jgi:HPt (histidine-containing phosphotransfer) domain-containing protein
MKPEPRDIPSPDALIPSGTLFDALIPDVHVRAAAYRVNTSEIDGEILSIFFEQLTELVASLRHAIPDREEETIREGAHALQGTGGTIGAPELSVVGVDLSAAARQGDFVRCAGLLSALEEWMRLQGREVPEPGNG